MTRKIRITCEIYTPNTIPAEYEDLPEGWDNWSKKAREDHLQDLAATYLAEHAGSGASVVDENDEEVDE